jgi:hypothetical protein
VSAPKRRSPSGLDGRIAAQPRRTSASGAAVEDYVQLQLNLEITAEAYPPRLFRVGAVQHVSRKPSDVARVQREP